MTRDEAASCLLTSAWTYVHRKVDDVVLTIEHEGGDSGEPAKLPKDPFTGRPFKRRVSPALQRLASRLAAAGLSGDRAFMSDLREVLEESASFPMFCLFAALDGEQRFEGDVRLELRVVDGPALPPHLHEIFSEHDPRKS